MRRTRMTWAGALATLLATTAAHAQAPLEPSPVVQPTPPPPRTGWGVQGLPLINYNSDEGLGYGARLLLVDSGDGTQRPYRHALLAQFFQTTVGVAIHRLSLDAPRLFDSPWRLVLDVALLNDRFSPYYGPVEQTAYTPTFNACVSATTRCLNCGHADLGTYAREHALHF